MTLRVKNWDSEFENNRTRGLKRMEWVPIPNKMDGLGYAELVDHPNGAAHLGAWLAIVEIASKADVRGTLPREGAEIPQALARISRLPAGIFEEVIPRLLDTRIGWLEHAPNQQDTEIPQEGAGKAQESAGIPQEGAPSRAREEGNGREWKGMEGNGTEPARPPSPQTIPIDPKEALGVYFPAADDAIVQRITDSARMADNAISRDEIGIWIHALMPEDPRKKPKSPAWFTRVLPEFLAERPQDVKLVRAFASGQLPMSEAGGIIHAGRCDWRVSKALRVWVALQTERPDLRMLAAGGER